MLKKIRLIIFSDVIFLLYFLHYFVSLDNFTLSLLINLIVFILPGIGWVNVFFRRGISDQVAAIFWIVFISSSAFILGIIIHPVFRINLTSFTQLIYIVFITNIGILISQFPIRRQKQIDFIKSLSGYLAPVIIFLAVYAGSYIGSVYNSRPLEDHDFERQATAYGLLKHFKPYLLTDRKTIFYLAHPPLMHFYSAYTILLSDKLDRMKYYYYTALEGEKLLKGEFRVGESFCFSDPRGLDMCAKITGIKDGYLKFAPRVPAQIETDYNGFISADNDMLDTDTFRNARLWRLIKEEYNYFRNQPHLLETRMANFLFSALAAMALFYLVFHITGSRGLSFLGALVFSTLPPVFILSAGGLHVALTNFLLISLAYGYITTLQIMPSDKYKYLTLFFMGLSAAWSTHVAVILPIAIIFREYFTRLKSGKIPHIFANAAVTGFIAGIFLFLIYGIGIDAKTFYRDHIRYHLWDRIFHINSLGYGGYPSIAGLWKIFGYELGYPFFPLALCALLFSFRRDREIDTRETILSFWFLTGAIAFSVVDWRDAAHLVFIIAPAIITACAFISRQKFDIKLWLVFFLCYALIRNIWFILK